MKVQPLGVICIGVVVTCLCLGLWPFHAPRNEVSWLSDSNGLRYGIYATAFSLRPLPELDSGRAAGSVEIWLHPWNMKFARTITSFSRPDDLMQFSLFQSATDLILVTDDGLWEIDHVFKPPRRLFLAVTFGASGVRVYVDGALIAQRADFPVPARALSGRLILGDLPGQSDNWHGRFLGLAIYGTELGPEEIAEHFAEWKANRAPAIRAEQRNTGLYLFNERSGHIAHDRSPFAADLYIPERYTVLNKLVLEPFWSEIKWSRTDWSSALKNIVGFVPLGFCFCAYLQERKRAVFLTMIAGALVSFSIEALQGLLPTRDSGTIDIFTNTLGSWIGAAVYRRWPALPRWAPWLEASKTGK